MLPKKFGSFLRAAKMRFLRFLTLASSLSRPDVPENVAGSVIIARVVGNDLFPRHGKGQMLTNLRFILEHEPNFTDVTKLFILNRLTDANEQKEAQRLIAEYGHEVLVLPFVADEYAALGWNLEPFGSLDFFTSPEFYSHGFQSQMRKKILACRPKINYAMNVNGARNAAIKAGRKVAEWTVVLDGSCI